MSTQTEFRKGGMFIGGQCLKNPQLKNVIGVLRQ